MEDGERTPLRELMRDWWFNCALVAIFLGGATELGMAQWLPAFAETALKYPQESIRTRLWHGEAVSVALFLAGSFCPVRELAVAACVLSGLTGSRLWPTMLATTADRYPNGGATMFGALAALGNVGGIFMPWAVGIVADHSNLHWGLAVSAIAPLLMLPLVLLLGRNKAVPLKN